MKTWYSCSPIRRYFDSNEIASKRIQLSKRIFIEPLQKWLEEPQTQKDLPEEEREAFLESALVVGAEYPAASYGDPDPDWQGNTPRGVQKTISEEILLTPLAFWLVRATSFSTSSIVHFQMDESYGIVRNVRRGAQLRVSDMESREALTPADVVTAKNLFESILTLPRQGTVWTAMRILHKALTEQMWEVRFLLQWIVLEALFGPDSVEETTHKLCERLATFLEKAPATVEELFHRAKASYGWRSKIVHGLKLHKLEKSEELSQEIESFIRKSLVAILTEPKFLAIFDCKRRDEFLTSLVFRNSSAA